MSEPSESSPLAPSGGPQSEAAASSVAPGAAPVAAQQHRAAAPASGTATAATPPPSVLAASASRPRPRPTVAGRSFFKSPIRVPKVDPRPESLSPSPPSSSQPQQRGGTPIPWPPTASGAASQLSPPWSIPTPRPTVSALPDAAALLGPAAAATASSGPSPVAAAATAAAAAPTAPSQAKSADAALGTALRVLCAGDTDQPLLLTVPFESPEGGAARIRLRDLDCAGRWIYAPHDERWWQALVVLLHNSCSWFVMAVLPPSDYTLGRGVMPKLRSVEDGAKQGLNNRILAGARQLLAYTWATPRDGDNALIINPRLLLWLLCEHSHSNAASVPDEIYLTVDIEALGLPLLGPALDGGTLLWPAVPDCCVLRERSLVPSLADSEWDQMMRSPLGICRVPSLEAHAVDQDRAIFEAGTLACCKATEPVLRAPDAAAVPSLGDEASMRSADTFTRDASAGEDSGRGSATDSGAAHGQSKGKQRQEQELEHEFEGEEHQEDDESIAKSSPLTELQDSTEELQSPQSCASRSNRSPATPPATAAPQSATSASERTSTSIGNVAAAPQIVERKRTSTVAGLPAGTLPSKTPRCNASGSTASSVAKSGRTASSSTAPGSAQQTTLSPESLASAIAIQDEYEIDKMESSCAWLQRLCAVVGAVALLPASAGASTAEAVPRVNANSEPTAVSTAPTTQNGLLPLSVDVAAARVLAHYRALEQLNEEHIDVLTPDEEVRRAAERVKRASEEHNTTRMATDHLILGAYLSRGRTCAGVRRTCAQLHRDFGLSYDHMRLVYWSNNFVFASKSLAMSMVLAVAWPHLLPRNEEQEKVWCALDVQLICRWLRFGLIHLGKACATPTVCARMWHLHRDFFAPLMARFEGSMRIWTFFGDLVVGPRAFRSGFTCALEHDEKNYYSAVPPLLFGQTHAQTVSAARTTFAHGNKEVAAVWVQSTLAVLPAPSPAQLAAVTTASGLLAPQVAHFTFGTRDGAASGACSSASDSGVPRTEAVGSAASSNAASDASAGAALSRPEHTAAHVQAGRDFERSAPAVQAPATHPIILGASTNDPDLPHIADEKIQRAVELIQLICDHVTAPRADDSGCASCHADGWVALDATTAERRMAAAYKAFDAKMTGTYDTNLSSDQAFAAFNTGLSEQGGIANAVANVIMLLATVVRLAREEEEYRRGINMKRKRGTERAVELGSTGLKVRVGKKLAAIVFASGSLSTILILGVAWAAGLRHTQWLPGYDITCLLTWFRDGTLPAGYIDERIRFAAEVRWNVLHTALQKFDIQRWTMFADDKITLEALYTSQARNHSLVPRTPRITDDKDRAQYWQGQVELICSRGPVFSVYAPLPLATASSGHLFPESDGDALITHSAAEVPAVAVWRANAAAP